MPDFDNMNDRKVIKELARYRALAESCAAELLRRAEDEEMSSGH